MLYITLPDNGLRRPSFYLAMEDYMVMSKWLQQDALFMWQVPPSVVIGRNQVLEAEVNTGYCREHGIGIYRRRSGGGCVYADMGNLMVSYITPEESVALAYNRYVTMIVTMLRRLGVDACADGRNDVMVGRGKVGGNAFCHVPGYSIVHGTLLFDTDMQHMACSITPNNDKMASKGVQSVRQRISLLKDYVGMDIDAFRNYMKSALCSEQVELGADDVSEIERLEHRYLDERFVFGGGPRYSTVHRSRIEGVGDVELHMEVHRGVLKGISMSGDFFVEGDLDGMLQQLGGTTLTHAELQKRVPDDIAHIVKNLDKDQFINLLIYG